MSGTWQLPPAVFDAFSDIFCLQRLLLSGVDIVQDADVLVPEAHMRLTSPETPLKSVACSVSAMRKASFTAPAKPKALLG